MAAISLSMRRVLVKNVLPARVAVASVATAVIVVATAVVVTKSFGSPNDGHGAACGPVVVLGAHH